MRNLGGGQAGFFEDVTTAAGIDTYRTGTSYRFAPRLVDLDRDGHLDLAIASDFVTSQLFWNEGDATFTEGTLAAGVGTDRNGMGSTFGDYDGDGDLDWFITNITNAPENPGGSGGWNRLYRNNGKRVEATWITFPLLVAGTSAAAFAGAYWLKGDTLRVNQVEIIDVEGSTGLTRGTLVTHLFSPRALRYDLALAARSLDGSKVRTDGSSTAWLGKPGYGLGGMQSGNGGTGATRVRADYQIDATPQLNPDSNTIAGLPVQVWSTKTLVSRYTAESVRGIMKLFAASDRARDAFITATVSRCSVLDYSDVSLRP